MALKRNPVAAAEGTWQIMRQPAVIALLAAPILIQVFQRGAGLLAEQAS
jgi:hypothetical protein